MRVKWVFIALTACTLVTWGDPGTAKADDAGRVITPSVDPNGLPIVTERYAVPLPGNAHVVLDVFAAAQNAGQSDPQKSLYVYAPPLIFMAGGDGRIDASILDDATAGTATVTAELLLFDERLAGSIATRLSSELGRAISERQVRPLALTFLEIRPTAATGSAPWVFQIPQNATDIPAAARTLPLQVQFRSRAEAEGFVISLRRGSVLSARFGYAGYRIREDRRTLTTSSLRDTNFLGLLSGPAKAEYVTRDQVRRALVVSAESIGDTWYIEDPSIDLQVFSWFNTFFPARTVAWDQFMSDYAGKISSFGYSPDDLKPEKITKFLSTLKTQMQSESQDTVDLGGETKGTAEFLGIKAGADTSGRYKKDEIRKLMRLNDQSVEWDGEKYIPKTIKVLQLDASAFKQDMTIASKVITTRDTQTALTRFIGSGDLWSSASSYASSCDNSAPDVAIDSPKILASLLAEQPWLTREKATFGEARDFYNWLAAKPRLRVRAPIKVDGPSNFIVACEIDLEQGGAFVSEGGNEIRLLTLTLLNNGGSIQSDPETGASTAAQVAGQGPGGASYNTSSRSGSDGTHDGGTGGQGAQGVAGGTGGAAGNVTIAALEIRGALDLRMHGGRGGQGGEGGQGGQGGNGIGASSGASSLFDCKGGGSQGGRGGDGGVGGTGGPGGQGGPGPLITIVTASALPAGTVFDATGGDGGPGGPGGRRGGPGRGGDGSGGDGYCSGHGGGAAGVGDPNNDAQRGQGGVPGPAGQAYPPQMQTLIDNRKDPNFLAFANWVGAK